MQDLQDEHQKNGTQFCTVAQKLRFEWNGLQSLNAEHLVMLKGFKLVMK